jgi:hypothetical protein
VPAPLSRIQPGNRLELCGKPYGQWRPGYGTECPPIAATSRGRRRAEESGTGPVSNDGSKAPGCRARSGLIGAQRVEQHTDRGELRLHVRREMTCTHRLLFLICSVIRLNSPVLNDNRRQDMAIECRRCGGPTMLETMITLRRGILGFRETRAQGAYCATCKLSLPIELPFAMRPSIAISGRPRSSFSGFWPMWLRVAPARSGGVEWV